MKEMKYQASIWRFQPSFKSEGTRNNVSGVANPNEDFTSVAGCVAESVKGLSHILSHST